MQLVPLSYSPLSALSFLTFFTLFLSLPISLAPYLYYFPCFVMQDGLGRNTHYCQQLLALDSCPGPSQSSGNQGTGINGITTTLHLAYWKRELACHRDNQFTQFILKGIQQDFRIGFSQGSVSLKSICLQSKAIHR